MGIFITFEGIDGSGKTRVSHIVADALSADYNVLLTKEPTDRALFTTLRNWQKGQLAGREGVISTEEKEHILSVLPAETTGQQDLFNFLLDRSLHAPKLREALEQFDIVICDRYHDSTVAYQFEDMRQLFGNPEQPEKLEVKLFEKFEQLKSPAFFGWPVPDLTLFLDVEPEVAKQRREQRKPAEPNTIGELLESMERKTDMEKVILRYRITARFDTRIKTVNANKSLAYVVADCLRMIEDKLK